MTTAKQMITEQLERRTNLVEDIKFRKQCVEVAKKLGITSKEWNENKTSILLFMANEFCKIENSIK